MMNKMIWVKIMEQSVMRLIIFVTVISWYLLGDFIVYEFWPLEHRNLAWGLSTMFHFHLYCCIALVYSIFFPNKKVLIITFLLQTIVNVDYFTTSYPYRSFELCVRPYICLVIPVVISWYIKKSSNIKNNDSDNNRCDVPDSKKSSC